MELSNKGVDSTDTERLDYLDSIRGIAAFFVVVYHVNGCHWAWMTEIKILDMFFNGSDAVALFFVLSGLVLSLKMFKDGYVLDGESYRKFVFSRFFRLLPAYFFCLLVYFCYEHRSELFWDLFVKGFLKNEYFFWQELVLVRDYHILFLPAWTLGVELALSIFVPFMVLIVTKSQLLFCYFLGAVFFANKLYISEFFLMFGYGVLIAKNFKLVEMYQNQDKWWYRNRHFLILLVWLIWGIRHILRIFPLNESLSKLFSNFLFINEFHLTGLASAILLVYVINTGFVKVFLKSRFLLFLGRISFGLYLVHWFFPRIIMDNFAYFISVCGGSELYLFLFTQFFVIGLSLVFGTIVHHLIEVPFMKIGKKIYS